jgi:hypothetical protein
VKPQNPQEPTAHRATSHHQPETPHHKSSADGNESVAMFGDVDNDRLLPAEEEVADHRSEDDRQTEPGVVGHEDQHEHE